MRAEQVSRLIWVIIGAGVALLFATSSSGSYDASSGPDRVDPPHERRPTRPAASSPRRAVMASGTVVSRVSGYVRNVLLAAAIGNELHADLFNIGNTIPNMLYILLAGGVFNAVLVPQLVRAQKNDPDGGEAYTNRVITLAAALPRRVTVAARDRRTAGDAALPQRLVQRPGAGRPARLGDRLRALLPAAGLLLRDVRAARPGAQRARPVRPDDVGADRQQRDRRSWCWCSTCSGSARSTPAPAARRSPRRRSWSSASARRSASSPRS